VGVYEDAAEEFHRAGMLVLCILLMVVAGILFLVAAGEALKFQMEPDSFATNRCDFADTAKSSACYQRIVDSSTFDVVRGRLAWATACAVSAAGCLVVFVRRRARERATRQALLRAGIPL
jgi:hypothetical protein